MTEEERIDEGISRYYSDRNRRWHEAHEALRKAKERDAPYQEILKLQRAVDKLEGYGD